MIKNSFEYEKYVKYLTELPKIPQTIEKFKVLYHPEDFYKFFIKKVFNAKYRIYISTLYLEKDQIGNNILNNLYRSKKNNPSIDIAVLVDLHRAQRNRLGKKSTISNADWYYHVAHSYPNINIPIYGIPINTREILGVFHLKGFVIDNQVIYSGANLNNSYFQTLKEQNYRYDRYQIIQNDILADVLIDYLKKNLLNSKAVIRFDFKNKHKKVFKSKTRVLRKKLQKKKYSFKGKAKNNELSITPIVGLGKNSFLNKIINYLLLSTKYKLVLCTPYFNLPNSLKRSLMKLLITGKKIEIIVCDKTANDFYIPENKPFKLFSTLPYLYEINLRSFLKELQYFIDKNQLIIRLWKNGNNTFHIKGIWVDKEWILLTGNNLNFRSWKLDLENGLLIHDPRQSLSYQREKELTQIRLNTKIKKHFSEIQNIIDYPVKIKKFLKRIKIVKIDKIIRKIL